MLQRQALSKNYELVFKSKMRKQRASKTKQTVFARRQWKAREGLVASDFRVLVELKYYKMGSKSQVRGKMRGVIELY